MKKPKISVLISFSFLFSFSVLSTPYYQSQLNEADNLVTANNKNITLLGTQVNIGDKAPDFKVVDANFTPVTLSDFSGKTLLISAVPSLDTGLCSLQTQRFNQEVASITGDIVILTISNDLPYAQARFCKSEKIANLKVLSDSVWRDFGQKYGLLIKDMGLLTRSIFIIDQESNIIYKEIVPNISHLPNMDLALQQLKMHVSQTPIKK